MSGVLEWMVATWADWMPAMFLQGSLLLSAVIFTEAAVRRWAWPQLTHALWLLVPAKHFLPPTLFSPFSAATKLSSALPSATPDLSPSWMPALAALWLLGCVLFSTFALRRQGRLRRALLDDSIPAPAAVLAVYSKARGHLKFRKPPRLVLSSQTGSPAVLGLLRPVVVIPRSLVAELTPLELEHVLLHELAHVRRGDPWLQALFSLLHWVYWFQPLMPWALRRAYESRELCCDATVAAVLGQQAKRYRLSLLRTARAVLEAPTWPRPAAAALVAGGGTLERLRWLEKGSGRHPRRRRAIASLAFVAVALLVLPMAAESPAVRRAREEVTAAVAGGSSLQIKASVMALHGLLEREAAAD